MLPTLETLLTYKSTHILERYKIDYPNNHLTPEKAWNEMLKYFWLSKKHEHDLNQNPIATDLKFRCGIYAEMSEIDDMWHTFLLFTVEYIKFCKKFFGKYLHHIPNVHEEIIQIELFKIEFRRYVTYIYDNLGEETVHKWFGSLI